MNGSWDAIVDRGVGALLGLAIGDALGTTLEFSQRDRYAPLTDIVGGGPFRLLPGQWTDDTSMALCLADSLLACNGVDQRDLLRRFLAWYRRGENSVTGACFDIGMQTSAALNRFETSGEPECGIDAATSAGNGSVMRLAPVALRYHRDATQAREAARLQSRTTHPTAEAVEGCALLADILVEAIATGDRSRTLAPRELDSKAPPKIAAIARGAWRRSREDISSSGYVIDTLEAALWAVSEASDFKEAVLLAANLGGDADTVAAVTGQVAGALWGRSEIPPHWLDMLAWREDIEHRAVRLMDEGRIVA